MSSDKPKSGLFEQGMAIRRAVLGNEYVDRAMKNTDPETLPMQELVTEYCWGKVWTRPGLDHRARSILNLGMLSALNRPHELKIHVRGALNNGVTREEIMEICLQVAIYCGVPAGLDCQRVVRDTFKEIDGE